MKPPVHRPNGEKGSALMAALCLIFIAGMLTGIVLTLSRIATFDVRAHVELQRSAYINEGTANRIQWLLAADQSVYPASGTLGEVDYTEYEHDRYMADGVFHEIDYHGTPVRVVITDAASGMNLSGTAYRTNLQRISTALQLEVQGIADQVAALIAKITDYIDSDDELSTDGMEAGDYEDAKMEPLPRNGAIRFREEFFYIPGFLDLFTPDKYGRLSGVRLITPYGMTSIASAAPSFFTATELMLKIYGNLEDDEVAEVVKAREVWFKEKTKISEQLDELLVGRLKSGLSWSESGVYSVRIEAPEKSGRPSRRLFFTFPFFGISGPSDEFVHYYEWLMP